MGTTAFQDAMAEAQRKAGNGGNGALLHDTITQAERNVNLGAGIEMPESMASVVVTTRRMVQRMESGDMLAQAGVIGGIIRLRSGGNLPKQGRKISGLLGFRSENGAVRYVKIADAALAGVPATVIPLRKPTDPPKLIPAPIRYRSWADALAHEGVQACYNAARAALSDATEVPTRAEAFAKAVHSRVEALHRLMPLGDVRGVLLAVCEGRLLSEADVKALYTGPAGLFERGASWDDIVTEAITEAEAAIIEAEAEAATATAGETSS